MRLIDADKFLSYLIFSKHIDGLTCGEVKEAVEMCAVNKTGHCEDCEHFRKLPYHIDIIGKCIRHTGFCPKGDWYCADFEPQESEDDAK